MVSTKTLFALAVAFAWLLTGIVVAQNPTSPTLTDSPDSDDGLTLVYDPEDGNLGLRVSSFWVGEQLTLTTLEIESQGELFIPEGCQNLDGVFDVCRPHKIAKITSTGFGSLSFGNVLPTGLSGEVLVADLLADLAIREHCLVAPCPVEIYLYVVPEPSPLTLLGIGVLGLIKIRRCH